MNIGELVTLANEYAAETGACIRTVPYTVKPGLGAAAYHAVSDTVRLDPPGVGDTEAVIFCDLVHEFTHAHQRSRLGLAKYLFLKTFNRKKIEAEAERNGLSACEWYAERKAKNVYRR